jgi:signal transduction histidine kinase
MFRVYDCLTTEHHLGLVALSALLCVFATYTTVALLTHTDETAGWRREAWLGATAAVFGGGVWATHFVAMLGYRSHLPVDFAMVPTICSIVVSVVVGGVGFIIADAGKPWLGGAFVGLAVAGMHYIGMMALEVQARLAWDPQYVAVSVAISIVGGACSLRLLQSPPHGYRLAGAGALLALTILGLHFTGMAALTLLPDSSLPAPAGSVLPGWLAGGMIAVAALVIGAGLAASIVDRRVAARLAREAEHLRNHVEALEQARASLEALTIELRSATAKAESADRAKSEFLANMSHELRTPLNAVVGFSQLIAQAVCGPLNQRYCEYAQDIHDAGTHLVSIVSDILDLSKVESGHMTLADEIVDIAEMFDDCWRLMREKAASADLTLRFHPIDLRLRCDERRLKQALINLLSNAVKFTPAGGCIDVDAELTPSGGVAFSVKDTGVGMKPDDIPIALDPFGQLESALSRMHQGTGLGLPLVKNLIELHGGTLRIDSQPGVGTTVSIDLPADRVVRPDGARVSAAPSAKVLAI